MNNYLGNSYIWRDRLW